MRSSTDAVVPDSWGVEIEGSDSVASMVLDDDLKYLGAGLLTLRLVRKSQHLHSFCMYDLFIAGLEQVVPSENKVVKTTRSSSTACRASVL